MAQSANTARRLVPPKIIRRLYLRGRTKINHIVLLKHTLYGFPNEVKVTLASWSFIQTLTH